MTRRSFDAEYDAQAKFIYALIVAGKSANFADKACCAFLEAAAKIEGLEFEKELPFELLRRLSSSEIMTAAKMARTGNYKKITDALVDVIDLWSHEEIDYWTCKPVDLEVIPGIGRKTSRFFIMWIRPEEEYAALDVHVLRWMRKNGWPDAPNSTPGNQQLYEKLEREFIARAHELGKAARQLDEEIWVAGAGRTQETALPAMV